MVQNQNRQIEAPPLGLACNWDSMKWRPPKFFRSWIPPLLLLLAASLVANVWLTRRVLDYKGRLFVARQFPDDVPLLVQKDARQLVWLSGDSRVAAWSLPDTPNRRFINRGVSGFTARQVLDRLRADLASGTRPDVVVLQAGINDVLSAGYNRPSRVAPPRPAPEEIMQQCSVDLRRAVQVARDAGSQVILLTVFPPGPYGWRDWFFWDATLEAKVPELNDSLRALSGPGVALLDSAALLAPGGRTRAEYSADSLHLNLRGYAVLTDALERTLSELAPISTPSP